MALTAEQTAEIITTEKATHSELDVVNTPSNVSIWKLQKDVWASAASFISTLFDIRNVEAQAIADSGNVGIPSWVRKIVLDFQTGYVVSVVNFKASYAVIDEGAKIITRCSVTEKGNRVIEVKVAKSEPPTPLSNDEAIELKGYLSKIRFAGTEIKIVNKVADKVYLSGTVSFFGEYASVINDNVIDAVNAYYANLSSDQNFNGQVNLNEAIDAVKAVEGVVDFIPSELAIRPDITDFDSRTIIYSLSDSINNGQAPSQAGYIVEETESGYLLSDSLIFNPA